MCAVIWLTSIKTPRCPWKETPKSVSENSARGDPARHISFKMCQEITKMSPTWILQSLTDSWVSRRVWTFISLYLLFLYQVLQGTQGPLAAMEKLEMLGYQVLLGPQEDQEKLVQVIVYPMLQWISYIIPRPAVILNSGWHRGCLQSLCERHLPVYIPGPEG